MGTTLVRSGTAYPVFMRNDDTMFVFTADGRQLELNETEKREVLNEFINITNSCSGTDAELSEMFVITDSGDFCQVFYYGRDKKEYYFYDEKLDKYIDIQYEEPVQYTGYDSDRCVTSVNNKKLRFTFLPKNIEETTKTGPQFLQKRRDGKSQKALNTLAYIYARRREAAGPLAAKYDAAMREAAQREEELQKVANKKALRRENVLRDLMRRWSSERGSMRSSSAERGSMRESLPERGSMRRTSTNM